MTKRGKDDGDRNVDGTLPKDPAEGTEPMDADTSVRKATLRLVKDAGQQEALPLPSDPHAEAQLLASLMWAASFAPDALSFVHVRDHVSPEMFFTPGHAAIFAAIGEVARAQKHAEPVVVHSELVRQREERLAGGLEYLEQLVATAQAVSEARARAYADAIRDAWSRRRVVRLGEQIASEAKRAGQTAASVLESATQQVTEMVKDLPADSHTLTSLQVAKTLNDDLSKPDNSNVLETGFWSIDRMMSGGLYPKEVTLLAARTSVGKSSLAAAIAHGVAERNNGVHVLYVSLEMPAKSFMGRVVSARTGIAYKNIRRRTLTPKAHAQIVDELKRMATLGVHYSDSQLQTCLTMQASADRLANQVARSGGRLGLLVVDHLGLVKPVSRKGSREQEVAEISRWTRFVAEQIGCHVLGLVQVAREAERQGKSTMPRLHHLRESGALEQDADSVLILHREKDANGVKFLRKNGVLAMAKGRNDGTDEIQLRVDPWCLRFLPEVDLPPSDDDDDEHEDE